MILYHGSNMPIKEIDLELCDHIKTSEKVFT